MDNLILWVVSFLNQPWLALSGTFVLAAIAAVGARLSGSDDWNALREGWDKLLLAAFIGIPLFRPAGTFVYDKTFSNLVCDNNGDPILTGDFTTHCVLEPLAPPSYHTNWTFGGLVRDWLIGFVEGVPAVFLGYGVGLGAAVLLAAAVGPRVAVERPDGPGSGPQGRHARSHEPEPPTG